MPTREKWLRSAWVNNSPPPPPILCVCLLGTREEVLCGSWSSTCQNLIKIVSIIKRELTNVDQELLMYIRCWPYEITGPPTYQLPKTLHTVKTIRVLVVFVVCRKWCQQYWVSSLECCLQSHPPVLYYWTGNNQVLHFSSCLYSYSMGRGQRYSIHSSNIRLLVRVCWKGNRKNQLSSLKGVMGRHPPLEVHNS